VNHLLNQVWHEDARNLLRALPDASIDAVITDPMYGSAKNCLYDWGPDPARGDPVKHWQYHQPIYQDCLQILKPGGVLAWAMSAKFCEYYHEWFGGHRLWTLTRFRPRGKNATGHVWVVQTREQQPVEFPHRDSLVIYETMFPGFVDAMTLRRYKVHPCVKPVEEMAFMIEALTEPGQIVLNCFCGLGSGLVAAQLLNRQWIGCDKSRKYAQIAMKRLHDLEQGRVA